MWSGENGIECGQVKMVLSVVRLMVLSVVRLNGIECGQAKWY